MKLNICSKIQHALGLSEQAPQALIDPEDVRSVSALRMRLVQALAATSVGDLKGRNQLVAKDVRKKRYRLRLRFTLEWPVPLALDLTVINEDTLKVELVQDDTSRR